MESWTFYVNDTLLFRRAAEAHFTVYVGHKFGREGRMYEVLSVEPQSRKVTLKDVRALSTEDF